ncbi:MAG TPA: endonuclease NucS domain-containing protein [Fimbriimonadaceae bacterium]|nr:endonuclease NucS domain-containing protein [Fimbriimonadaceae bacterium]
MDELIQRLTQSEHTAPLTDFKTERQMQRFFANNLELLEPGLRLYDAERSVEFRCKIKNVGRPGSIDILAVDADGSLVVVELKLGFGNASALGQAMGYMAWLKKNLHRAVTVRAIIVCRQANPFLRLAIADPTCPNIKIIEYPSHLNPPNPLL